MSGDASVIRWPSCRRRRAASPVLPEELVVWEILVRLPAKPLLRCRAVCRSWRRRTSEAAFLLAHHRRQPSLPLVSFHGPLPAAQRQPYRRLPARARPIRAVVDAALDTLDLRPSPSVRNPVLGFNDYNYYRDYCVHASCDGLLLLSLGNNRFYLCNPATRQWTGLPSLTGATGVALYPHVSSGEYRVLYWKGGAFVNHRDVVYHVLTVGSSSSAAPAPRRIETAASASPSAKRFVAAGWLHRSDHPAVPLRGCLHWILQGSPPEKVIVVFYTAAESFRTMPSPVVAAWDWPRLLEMDATLAVSWVDKSQTMMKLWVLRDYERGVWSLTRRIIFPLVEIRSIVNNCRFHGTVVSEDGDVLLHCPRCFHMFHSDTNKGELLQTLCWRNVFPRPVGHCFRESLVRHQFFERQPGELRIID
ncbi:hypothetical protein EJB05_42749, partial [Eragrostis curvula]